MTSFVLNDTVQGNRSLDPFSNETGLIGPNGFLADFGTASPTVQMYGGCFLTVMGAISTDDIAIQTSQGGVIFIGSTGSILSGNNAVLARSGGSPYIANAGLIQTFQDSVMFDGGLTPGSATLTNSGEILSVGSSAIYSIKMLTTFITNHGLIQGAIGGIETQDEQTVRITNTGTIMGGQFAISIGGSQPATISNRGHIDGNVLLGNGGDQFHGRYGQQSLIYGRSGDDRITGGTGDEQFYGESGNDTLKGSGGDDLLNGGLGTDTLTGGTGDDALTGGGGPDVFVFGRGHGDDRILDFADTRDKIDLSVFHFANAAAVTSLAFDRPGGLLIDLTSKGGGTIFIDGMTAASFGGADMILA